MNTPGALAARLAVHPLVTATYPGSRAVLLLLNDAGLLALRGRGRQALLDQLQADIAYPGSDSPFNVRLLDTAPVATDLPAIDRLLEAPRPACATTLAEHEHDGVWKLTLTLPLELLCFDGHFPQAPVLPGVMQIAWALALAAPRLGTSSRCRDMKGLKFQRLLHPGDRVELHLHVDHKATATGGDMLHFSYRLGDVHCSSGRLLTGHAHD